MNLYKITQPQIYADLPCSVVACSAAVQNIQKVTTEQAKNIVLNIAIDNSVNFRRTGYLTIREMNRFVRMLFKVNKYYYHKRGTRPLLKELTLQQRAIVLIRGHYVFWHGDGLYDSFFDNANDEVVAYWCVDDKM